MPRPAEYDQDRVDTKVRLRADHVRLLREAQEERGLGRNRLVEMALDAFFGITPTGPRMPRPPAAPNLSQGSPKTAPRVTTRLSRPGQAMAARSEAAQGDRRAP